MGMQERKEDRALPKQRFLRIEIQYEASRGSTAGPTCMHTQHAHTGSTKWPRWAQNEKKCWRDDSEAKNTYCSFRGPRFGFHKV